MLGHTQQIPRIELKTPRMLLLHLPDTIQQLQENRRNLIIVPTHPSPSLPPSPPSRRQAMPGPQLKRVPKTQKIFFDQDLKPPHCPIERVKKNLGQRRHLRGAIPAMRAMEQDGAFFTLHKMSAAISGVEDEAEVGEPAGVFH
jgi:hypothetical protein